MKQNNLSCRAGVEQFFINMKPDARILTINSRYKLLRHGVDMSNIVLKQSLKPVGPWVWLQHAIILHVHENISHRRRYVR
jgi:hypothetical protein